MVGNGEIYDGNNDEVRKVLVAAVSLQIGNRNLKGIGETKEIIVNQREVKEVFIYVEV